MAVQTELYRKPEADEVVENEEIERRKELVATLGFTPQLQCVDELGLEASRFYPELTSFELEVWTLFHRTYYSKSKDEWKGYHFDRVPTSVLEEIRTADSLQVFDDIELWTPEWGKELDPMAVGVVGHRLGRRDLTHDLGQNTAFNSNARFFPIVRWGESLLPFTEIVNQVLRSRFKTVVSGFWGPVEVAPEGVPEAVLGYAQPLFEVEPRKKFFLERAGRFKKHCGSRMIVVNEKAAVCVVCGATS